MHESDGAARQIARWAALGALFLIPFTPLIVADSFFFPFITGKAFFFRILSEIAVVAWAVLACLDKEYRPRASLIGTVAIGFVLWMFVADAFALNAAKAFWSNFERMEGWVFLAHLLGFFFAAGAILRAEKKWRAWFFTSIGVSAAISAYALLQLAGVYAIHQGSVRIDASLGNSAYLAIYFLFSVFVALWLALTEERAWLKWLLVALAALEGVLIFFTETRGTIIGLALALALAALLTTLSAGKGARRKAAGALALILVLAGGLYLARDSDFIQNNRVLKRVASISLSDGQTRFTIWHMAFQGALERPLTGWGQEGFNYIFNKYYDPSLYHQEPWFDRAHNAFIDWLTAGGAPAFFLYLSLFGSAIALLWRSSELSRPERTLLTSALVGYAIHNLFVFDNLYSYIYFFALLALIDSQVARPLSGLEEAPILPPADGMTYGLPIAAVAVFALVWFVNVPGMRVASGLILAMTPSAAGPAENTRLFEELAARPAFAAQEIREQLISFAAMVVQSPQVPNAEKERAAALAIREMQKQVAAYPLDARERLQLASAYRIAGNGVEALREIRAAAELSPGKEEILIQEGAIAWDMGDAETASKAFAKAYALGPQFENLAAYAAAGRLAAGDAKAADEILLKVFGSIVVDNDVLAVAYYRTQSWPRLISLWKLRAERPGAPVGAWFSLAAAYYMAGDKASAKGAINKAVALYPDAASAGASALKQIESGTAGQ